MAARSVAGDRLRPIAFLASHSRLIALEKSHGVAAHGSTEKRIADTARRLKRYDPDVKVLFYFNAVINWPGYDAFKTYRPEWTLRDRDSMALAAAKGKSVIIKGWPSFNWLDKEMMKRPHDELLKLARGQIKFPLACFLTGARPGSQFCYSWGYTNRMGMLGSYPELDRRLGPPKADAVWKGLTASREFAHASVWIDLSTKETRIDWK